MVIDFVLPHQEVTIFGTEEGNAREQIIQTLFDGVDFRKSCFFILCTDSDYYNDLLGGRLLGEENGMDVGKNTSGRDGDAAE